MFDFSRDNSSKHSLYIPNDRAVATHLTKLSSSWFFIIFSTHFFAFCSKTTSLRKHKLVMDGKGKAGSSSSSSSSFTAQLFGLKEPSCSSSFKSIFPPPSKVLLLFLSLLLFYSCFCCLFWLVLEFYSSRFQGTTGNMILSSKHGSLGQWKSRSPTVFVLRTVYLNLRRLVSLLESIWFLFLYIKPSFVRKPSDSFLNQELSKLLHFSWN